MNYRIGWTWFKERGPSWIVVVALGVVLVSCGGEEGVKNPEVEVEAVLRATSEAPTLEEIAPYDEALVHHEYEVKRVLRGDLEAGRVVRVARWAVLGSKEQEPVGEIGSLGTMTLVPLDEVPGLDSVRAKDDLPFDPDESLYLDLSQSLASAEAPKQVRFDYRGDISRRMRIYWMTRHQLRLVVIGNSQAASAVAPRLFYQPENDDIPVALNMSPAGSGMGLQCFLAEAYLADLPRLEWIVWGVSPRIFNARAAYDRRLDIFRASPGHQYDRDHADELWPVREGATAVTSADLAVEFDEGYKLYGWSPRREYQYPVPLDAEGEREILRRCRMDRFKKSPELWEQFEKTIELVTGKGIKMLLFIPPYHPLVLRAKAADIDGTGHAAYREIVARLEAIAAGNPLVYFEDIHRGGEHDFRHEEFADPDHLFDQGALRMTPMLVEIVEREGASAETPKR